MSIKSGRLTIRDLAETAGVSAPTISKVLNGREDVAPATRERVLNILREYDYLPRGATAVPMANAHIEVAFDALETPNNLQILQGVLAAAADGRHVAVSVVPEENLVRAWVNELSRAGRAGLLMVTSRLSAKNQLRLHEVGLPVVMIDPVNIPPQDIVSVASSNWSGGVAATEHLLELGHRRIGFIHGREGVCDNARYHGYLAALSGRDLIVDPDLVRRGDFRFDLAVEAASALLSGPRRPTAIFAANDLEAVGVVEAARRLRLSVPQDLSVVGFDDGVVARSSSPPLTTIRQPFSDMGVVAYQSLVELIERRRPLSTRVELATALVVRESTAKAP